MLPIRDHNPSGRTPYVTYALMAINIVVFISYWPLFADPRGLNEFFYEWSMVPVLVTMEGTYHTIFTSMFLHGGFMHLAGNMLFLWIFGDNMEDEMGHFGYLLFYLAAGMGAGLAHVAAGPYSQVPTVGASGAIAGVMGGYLLLFPKARVDILLILIVYFRIFSIPAWIMLGVWFAIQLFGGAGSDLNSGGVAYWAHAGGFVVGLVLTLPVFLRRGGPGFWDKTDGHPPHPEAKYPYVKSNIPVIKRK
ncbi:rhomboid family intramembrane serine protease [Roseovarius faecimaris]|uniref:Rhomboid family intramembrane serine protease n=1 Tax=Roseovarius faecimaris TaxID=2494550 RepID=A0A6I6IPF7_9RHOB|nr:rhomboid family intramembrane serine protease [Roseovarius faecimaris]QGX98939.1 rhomboid family intramembrane serine protease [Roseovarius faecimaris]